MKRPIVAIDGPAGAGKSTVARMVAETLGYVYIDTGAMYRAVACRVIDSGLPVSEHGKIAALANSLEISFEPTNEGQRLIVDGEDLTERIRTPEATRLSSPISAIQGVRKRMVELQRRMGSAGGVVMEGRDIGTVVFPNAGVKVFLTASTGERARRRAEEMRAKGMQVDEDDIAEQIRDRDLRDSTREHAPLQQAPDAILIDTDPMSIEQVVAEIMRIHNEKVAE